MCLLHPELLFICCCVSFLSDDTNKLHVAKVLSLLWTQLESRQTMGQRTCHDKFVLIFSNDTVQVAVMAAMSAKRKSSGSPNGHSNKKAKKVTYNATHKPT